MNNDLMLMSGAAYDAQALNGLKRDVASDPTGNLKRVAQQIEGLFLQTMMKSMRETLPKDGMFSSEQTRLYTSMYDQQISQQMSQKGVGLADMMVKQLSGAIATIGPAESAGTVPMRLDSARLPVAINQKLLHAYPPPFPEPKKVSDVQKTTPTSPSHPVSASSDFVSRLSTPAWLAGKESGIPHEVIVAQAALESNWGKREILTEDGSPSHNLFGIKSGKNWDGPTTEITTTEFEQGLMKKVKARFRVYSSYAEGLADYVKMLTNNPRYSDVASAKSPEQAANALQDAGYATDPQYANKLITLINQIKNAGAQVGKTYSGLKGLL